LVFCPSPFGNCRPSAGSLSTSHLLSTARACLSPLSVLPPPPPAASPRSPLPYILNLPFTPSLLSERYPPPFAPSSHPPAFLVPFFFLNVWISFQLPEKATHKEISGLPPPVFSLDLLTSCRDGDSFFFFLLHPKPLYDPDLFSFAVPQYPLFQGSCFLSPVRRGIVVCFETLLTPPSSVSWLCLRTLIFSAPPFPGFENRP